MNGGTLNTLFDAAGDPVSADGMVQNQPYNVWFCGPKLTGTGQVPYLMSNVVLESTGNILVGKVEQKTSETICR